MSNIEIKFEVLYTFVRRGKSLNYVTLLCFTGFTYEMCVGMQLVANKNCTPTKAVWQIKQQCF